MGFVLSGANTRIRTGDLILTKDVLCRLSHISKLLTVIYYIISKQLCQGKFTNLIRRRTVTYIFTVKVA